MRSFLSIVGLAVAIGAASASWYPGAGEPTTVGLDGVGKLTGRRTSRYQYFLGIPYGESVAPPNRFMPPVAKKPWTGSLNATVYSPGCWTAETNPDTPAKGDMSENCLTLDVYAPATPSSDPAGYPVMVFNHGGGDQEGMSWGADDVYNGVNLVSNHDVVTVSINYRLGPLGFLRFHDTGIAGNMGLQDLHLALQWVQKHIGSFGGDASRVTLQGESAGGQTVAAMLAVPTAAGLFQRLIIESGPLGMKYSAVQDAETLAAAFCKQSGCSGCDMQCMQSADITNLTASWMDMEFAPANWAHGDPIANLAMPFRPVIDGQFLPDNVMTLAKQGRIATVPTLAAFNSGEGYTFTYPLQPTPMPDTEYLSILTAVFGLKDALRIKAHYKPQEQPGDARPALAQAVTDWLFRCSQEHYLSAINTASGGSVKTYGAMFDYVASGIASSSIVPEACQQHMCHAEELPLVFGNPLDQLGIHFDQRDEAVANASMAAWVAFATSGDPSTPAHPWAPFESTSRLSLRIMGNGTEMQTSDSICPFWDGIGYEH